jgi:histidine triad (HIT) family protein
MENCAFCSIVKGDAPASIVCSDDKVLAFMDNQPINSGHVLVIPKVHVSQLSELDEDTGGQIFKVAMRVSEGLRRSDVKCEGINLFLADGEATCQEVFHVHLHVIPRFRGDGFGVRFGPHYGLKPDKKELDRIALSIKKGIH